MLTIQTPGKVMILGEWNILTPGHHCIAIPTRQSIHTTINASSTWYYTSSILQKPIPFNWDTAKKIIHWNETTSAHLAMTAIATTLDFLTQNHYHCTPATITSDSTLFFVNNTKIGLGSSAAVVAGIVEAILSFFSYPITQELIFTLAYLAHFKAQGNCGSGFDTAIASMRQPLWYQRPSIDFTTQIDTTNLLKKPWHTIQLQAHTLPTHSYITIGYSGKPAHTPTLINAMQKYAQTNQQEYFSYIQKLEHIVCTAYTTSDNKKFAKLIQHYRIALHELATAANIQLETDELTELITIAHNYGAQAKLSGAGGGDCVIAYSTTRATAHNIYNAWQAAGFIPIDILCY